MRWLFALILVGGCDDVFGLAFIPDAQPLDAAMATCYGRYGAGQTGLFQFCTTVLGTYPPVVDLSIDTDHEPICAPSAAAACVVTAPSIDVIGTLRAIGSRPLVLVSASTLVVHGTIDVSSNGIPAGTSTAVGAGADPSTCPSATLTTPSAGGPGGSFQTIGGAGGGPVTTPAAPAMPASLSGGCPGQSGVTSLELASEGFGGAGGGAVYLIAATSIAIVGSIDASGSPGTGASADQQDSAGGGGGGGGAGGLIGLDSPTIAITGFVSADGGGGGGGGGFTEGGATGGRAMILDPTTPPAGGPGGSGSPAGCDGGGGFAGGTPAGSSTCTDSTGAGGGGGGGAGYVKAFGQLQPGGMVSPAAD